MTRVLNLLFTSAGRRVELIEAFRRASGYLGLDSRIVVTDIDPLAPTFQVADAAYVVPRTEDNDFLSTISGICLKEKIDLAFPLTDTDIVPLASHRAFLEKQGTRAVVLSPEHATLTRDKWQTYLFFRRHDVPTPLTWLPNDPALAGEGFPVFVKPRTGSAGKHSWRADTEEDLDFLLGRVPDPVVQEFLSGREITTDVVSDFEGTPLGAVSRERIETRAGEVSKGRTVCDRTVLSQSVKIARLLGAVGPITVQCLLRGEEPCFTEVNARFGGGAPLGFAAGFDSPRWLLALAAQIPVEVPPLGTYAQDLYMTRCDRSFFLTAEDYGQAKSGPVRP